MLAAAAAVRKLGGFAPLFFGGDMFGESNDGCCFHDDIGQAVDLLPHYLPDDNEARLPPSGGWQSKTASRLPGTATTTPLEEDLCR